MRDVINIEKEPYNFAVSIESVSLFDFELNLFRPMFHLWINQVVGFY